MIDRRLRRDEILKRAVALLGDLGLRSDDADVNLAAVVVLGIELDATTLLDPGEVLLVIDELVRAARVRRPMFFTTQLPDGRPAMGVDPLGVVDNSREILAEITRQAELAHRAAVVDDFAVRAAVEPGYTARRHAHRWGVDPVTVRRWGLRRRDTKAGAKSLPEPRPDGEVREDGAASASLLKAAPSTRSRRSAA